MTALCWEHSSDNTHPVPASVELTVTDIIKKSNKGTITNQRAHDMKGRYRDL